MLGNEPIIMEQKPPKKSKLPLIIGILLIIITIIIIGIIILMNVKSNEEKQILKLSVYKNEDDYLCGKFDAYKCNVLAFDIIINDQDARILSVNYDSSKKVPYVLYIDEKIKLYNDKTKETKDIDIPNNYQKYEIVEYYDTHNNSVPNIYGITYYNTKKIKGTEYKDDAHYYDLQTNKTYDYYVVEGLQNRYISVKKNVVINNEIIDYLYIIDLDNNKTIIERESLDSKSRFEVLDGFIVFKANNGDYIDETYYTMNGQKVLYLLNHSVIGQTSTVYKNYLYVINDNNIVKYDSNGNIVDSDNINKYKDKLGFFNNYLLAVNDNKKLLFVNVGTENELEISDFKDTNKVNSASTISTSSTSNYFIYVEDHYSNCRVNKYNINVDTQKVQRESASDINCS